MWSPKGTTLRVIRCPTLQVSQFLFPGQRSDTFLTDLVRKDIKEQDAKIKFSRKTYRAELLYLNTRVDTWLKKRKEIVTAEMFRIWLHEARTEACHAMVRSLFVSCKKELVTTGINFRDNEISRLQAELSSNVL